MQNDAKASGAASPRRWWAGGWLPAAAISLGSALYVIFAGNPLESWELRWRDSLLRWRADAGLAPAVDPHVVHLDVTAADLGAVHDLDAEYRDVAALVGQASELHASVIVFDIVFGRGARDTAQPILDAIEKARARNCAVVLSEFLQKNGERVRSFPFLERMQPAGLINVQSDAEGVFRRYALVQRTPDGLEPSLALAAYFAWRELDRSKDVTAAGPDAVRWQELRADNSGLETRQAGCAPALLNFRASWETRGPAACPRYTRSQLQSLYDAKKELPSPNASPLANRVIFVSYVGPGIGDVATTPLGIDQPRALLHMSALNDLIQGNALRQLSRSGLAGALASLLVLGLAAGFCRRVGWLLGLWIGVSAGVLILSFVLLVRTNWVFDGVAVTSVWTAMIAARLIQRGRIPHESIPLAAGLEDALVFTSASVGSDARRRRVFISSRSSDYSHAREVHRFLVASGVESFFSEETLPERGGADYRREIDRALEEADHMIVVASSAASVRSAWVEAEWGFFVNELRASRKSGNIVIAAFGSFEAKDLPPALRYYEVIPLDAKPMEAILPYLGRLGTG